MITNSLNHLLLDDEPLDDAPLVGPVVPMRWMSNLFRLAFLEETDRQAVDAGRAPRHQAEIRRLRRMSMAPAVGRYYPVGDEADHEHFRPEQARQIVQRWRTRRPIPNQNHPYDGNQSGDSKDEYRDDDEYLDDSGEYLEVESLDDQNDQYDQHDRRKAPPRPFITAQPTLSWPLSKVEGSLSNGPHPLIARLLESELEDNEFEENDDGSEDEYPEESEFRPGPISRWALDVAIVFLAALLIVAAAWFVKARFSPQPTAPHPVPAAPAGPYKIVPSAVPRNSIPGSESTSLLRSQLPFRVFAPFAFSQLI